MRQGGDPRLPLELALVKVTRPASDLSRESLAFRLERLEEGHVPTATGEKPSGATPRATAPAPAPDKEAVAPLRIELEQLQEAWRRSILPAVAERSIPISSALGEARPAALAGDTLTLEFPQTAAFHLKLAEDSKNAALLRDALYEVTGRKLAVVFELGEAGVREQHDETPATEEDVLELMKSTFDARELEE
jgi:DNA polymerase-3 subunit gamma/tau